MTALEDRIRAALDADRPIPDLGDAVRAGARRRRERRAVAAIAVVTAIVATVLLGVVRLSVSDDGGARPEPAPQPSPSQQLLDPNAGNGSTARFLHGTKPASADLVGLWRLRNSDQAWLMLLGADGSWTTTDGWDLYGGGEVGNRGTWSLTGGRITLNGREGFLGAGFRQVLDVALMADGSLHQVSRPAEGRCGTGSCTRSTEPERFVFDRVAPGQPPLLRILASTSATPVQGEPASYLTGVWVSTDGHWVMTISAEHGVRAFRDRGDPSARPDDTGHVELDARGHLTFSCRHGSVLAVSEVALTRTAELSGIAPPSVRMTVQSTDGRCASGTGAPREWIRVSQRG